MSTARNAAVVGWEEVDLALLPKKRPRPGMPVAPAANLGAPGIFRRLGFYGMEQIEASILAGLVTGDPVLLIGPHGAAKTALVRRLAGELSGRKLQPGGRRLGMLRRNLLAVLAVERVLGRLDSEREAAIFYRTLLHSLPYAALGEAPAPSTLYPCHALAWRAATEGVDAGGVFARTVGRGDLEVLVQAYERQLAQLSEEDHHQTLN